MMFASVAATEAEKRVQRPGDDLVDLLTVAGMAAGLTERLAAEPSASRVSQPG